MKHHERRKRIMKRNITLTGIFILVVFGLTLLSGCAEKKAVVTEGEQKAAPAAQEQAAKAETTAPAEVSLSDINFDFDKYDIRPDARVIMKTNADILLKNNASKITIEGHCDERGTAEYNMALGERRAQETKKYLVNMGVNAARMKTISYGEERPLDSGHNEEAWAKNRRAHFAVTP
jgi:peptidoglycan-associated lipoprotein